MAPRRTSSLRVALCSPCCKPSRWQPSRSPRARLRRLLRSRKARALVSRNHIRGGSRGDGIAVVSIDTALFARSCTSWYKQLAPRDLLGPLGTSTLSPPQAGPRVLEIWDNNGCRHKRVRIVRATHTSTTISRLWFQPCGKEPMSSIVLASRSNVRSDDSAVRLALRDRT